MSTYFVFSIDSPRTKPRPAPKPRYRRGTCKRCVALKTACDGREPCAKCKARRIPCEYGYMSRMSPKKDLKHLATKASSQTLTISTTSTTLVKTSTTPPHTSPELHLATPLTPATSAEPLSPLASQFSPTPTTDLSGIINCLQHQLLQSYLELAVALDQPTAIPASIAATPLTNLSVARPAQGPELAEDQLYSPSLVRFLIAVFVNYQTRIFRDLYLERLYRKLAANKISPFALNCILAYGACLSRDQGVDASTRQRITGLYLDRADALLIGELERPSLDTPCLVSFLGAPSMTIMGDDRFMYYSGLARQLTMQLGFHLKRTTAHTLWHKSQYSPFVECGSSHCVEDAEDELVEEYKRRTFWSMAIYNATICCLMGTSCVLTSEYIDAEPVDDTLIQRILTCDPAHDPYPSIVPGLSNAICGYPYLTDYVMLSAEVTQLRVRAQQHDAVTIQDYYDLNGRLRAWYEHLPPHYHLPPLHHDHATFLEDPAHYSSLFSLHGNFHMTVIFLNVYNWNAGPDTIRPEQDQLCHQIAMESADFFTTRCLPFFRRLPCQYHTLFVVVNYFAVALKYALALPFLTSAQHHQTQELITEYLTLLSEFTTYATYSQVFVRMVKDIADRAHSMTPE
ncbi:hypothetical protein H4R35_004569 [Dimargaris xerosporica]|nr:hypothetical protein H4R35_004569 [Dimargaris xerosporica]